ncbi:hypothetical protein BC833DRAFT_545561, partial [Globomyces pollinis-pini]
MKIFNHAAEMVHHSRMAKPSKFHLFLRHFLKSGNLIRHYTMNVDCLENYVRTRADNGMYRSLDQVTVRLHGEILKARCFRCNHIYDISDAILCSWKQHDSQYLIACSEKNCLMPERPTKLRKIEYLPANFVHTFYCTMNLVHFNYKTISSLLSK